MKTGAMKTSQIRQRGSALITAVIFSFIIGALAITFLKLATSEYRASVRSTLYASSLNLAESGVEMGINALNTQSTTGSTWSKTVTNFLDDGVYEGDVKLVVFRATSRSPVIYAEGEIKGHPNGPVKKQVRVELSSGFAPFEKGFSARNGITFSGNGVLLDSYNSKYGDYNGLLDARAPFGYGTGGYNKNSDIWVASDSLASTDGVTVIDAGNGDIYGKLAVSPGNKYTVGPNGSVTDYANPGIIDDTRISGDFYADFPVTAHPSASATFTTTVTERVKIQGNWTDVVTSKSYPSISEDVTITGGTAATPVTYAMSEISGGEITINGHVVLVMSGDIKLSGQSGITITSGSSLSIYTQDDVAIAGQGVANANGTPSSFNLYGTAPATYDRNNEEVAAQSISISGNGQLFSAVYAPTADVTLNGGGSSGEVMGGVVALTAKLTGGSSFHFDEALRDIVDGGGSYSIESWLEMTGTTTASAPLDLSSY